MNHPQENPVMIAPDLLTVKQVAVRLQIGTNLVYELARAGKLPSTRLGNRWRFPRVALEKYVQGLGN